MLKYVVAELQDGRKVVFGSGPDSYPIPAELTKLVLDTSLTPPNAVRVPAGSDIQKAANSLQRGQVLALERGGRWPVTVRWSTSGNGITTYGDTTKADPVIGGIVFDEPVDGFVAESLVIRPISHQDRCGIEYHQPGGSGLRFIGVDVRGFVDNISIHHPGLRKAPRQEWIKGVTLLRCKSTGARAKDAKKAYDGQGGYFSNIVGLRVEECFIDDNGDASKANIFRHGLYIDAETAEVLVVRSIFTRNASYGCQVRSSGAAIEQCVFYDNGIAGMVNGDEGHVADNAVVLGHMHVKPWQHGQGGFDCHIGSGYVKGNYILGPARKAPAGWYQMEPINVSPRKKDDSAPWAYDKPTRPTLDGNVIRMDRTIELLGQIAKLHAVKDHEPIRLEMAEAIRRAAR